MKSIFLFLIILTFCANSFFAQNGNATLSGYISDAQTGEKLIAANIYVKKIETGTSANVYGFYSLTLPKGKYAFVISYIGYESIKLDIDLTESKTMNFALKPESVKMNEVVVKAKKTSRNIESAVMGVNEIRPKDIEAVPVILGEKDILKTIQLMPGVSPVGEGNSGFFVRGGQSDQNLILLDEATVYNPSHLMGFFSVFNSDAIKNTVLIKGGMPPEYGGRLSSAMIIAMKEGSTKRLGVSGGIGLISSRLSVEGPIVRNKSSFLISGRRTYADLFTAFTDDKKIKNSTLYFYDFNLKLNYEFDNNNRLFLSGYFGRDVFSFSDEFGFDWGNITSTLRWNHLFSDKLFSNNSIIFSKYDYMVSVRTGNSMSNISSSIQDINLKSDFQYYVKPDNIMKFGASFYYHIFLPGIVETEEQSNLNNAEIQKTRALESALYISDELKFKKKASLNYGLRLSNFTIFGPQNVYEFNEYGDVVKTTSFASGQIVESYTNLEPRIGINFMFNPESSVKLGYARNSQYLHLLSTSTTSTPLDIWQPSTKIVAPATADQISAGYFRNFDNNNYESYVEFYYKSMGNLVDYKNGADILLNEYVESQLTFGRGIAYGMEVSLKKNSGAFTGWLSYTLSKSERIFSEINGGKAFPARQDRTHDFSITLMYKIIAPLTFSLNWIYYTGDAVTFPSGKYSVDGATINLYSARNASRMPDYHRLDLGLDWIISKSDNSEMSLVLSVYNVYSRRNAYTISFKENETNPRNTEAVRLALFSIVPSITFNFRF